MDKNTFTGLFLILIIIVASTYFLKPDQQEINREKHIQDSTALAKSGKASASKPATVSPAPDSAKLHGNFPGALSGEEKVVTLENDQIKVNIGTKGGRIISVELKEFKTYDQKPLIMFEGDSNRFGVDLISSGTKLNTNDLFFTTSSASAKISGTDSASAVFRLTYAGGKFIDYVYTLKGSSYTVGFTIVSKGMSGAFPDSKTITLNWESILRKKEKDLAAEQRSSTAYYQLADTKDVEHLNVAKDETKNIGEKGKVNWISFKQHFFSNVLIAKEGFAGGSVSIATPIDTSSVKSFKANMQLPAPQSDSASVPMEFYFGPNQFSTLKAQGHDLERQVELGYWPLKYINRFAVLPIFEQLDKFHWNYGLIILVLTVLLKLVLSPLTYKSYLSMAKMRVLKPEMDEIKSKVGEDNPTLLQQEYLKLYKKAGVNPLGGCIPMLLQLPIVMAFFFFFPNLFELRQESFLWMKDLSTYDAFFTFGFKIPFLGNHISLMCMLMTISTLIYTYFNNQISGATGQMKYIGYISPIIFLGVLNSYPAGLNYYYFLANMLTFLQQFIIRLMVDDKKIHAQIQENKKKPQTKKKSGFSQRMEEYMKQQQAKTAQAKSRK
jgi:YidC/Oxa1 family membrane protein insertase